jgi:hypothetical protein
MIPIDLAGQVIDFLFVSFVIGTSWVALKGSQRPKLSGMDAGVRQLSDTLRNLVDEAAMQSSNLDRNLQKRKRELEGLLTDLNDAESNAMQILERLRRKESVVRESTGRNSIASHEARLQVSTQQNSIEENDQDLIELSEEEIARSNFEAKMNQEFLFKKNLAEKRIAEKKQNDKQVYEVNATSSDLSVKKVFDESEIQTFAQNSQRSSAPLTSGSPRKAVQSNEPEIIQQKSTASVYTRALRSEPSVDQRTIMAERSPREQVLKAEMANSLQQQIESMKNAGQEDAAFEAQFPHLDGSIVRIAKRLLLSGKEIHIVARKLELPVSEIRRIEILLRGSAAEVEGEKAAMQMTKEIQQQIEHERAVL